MKVSVKSALPPLVAKELAAELIRLPLLRTELALQSHDFLISIAYIVRRRSRQAFCISFVNTALKFVARRRTTCTPCISDLRVLRHDKNTICFNTITATSIAFIPRAHWNINSQWRSRKTPLFKVQYFQFAGPKLHFSDQDRYSHIG